MFSVNDKIMVYPIDRANMPIIKSAANYADINLCRLVSLRSWGHEGEHVKCSEGHVIEISCDYENALDDCTALWVIDSWNEMSFNNRLEPAIRLASKKGKRIVCSRGLSIEEKSRLSDIDVTYVDLIADDLVIDSDYRVQEIRVPVVFVMSSTEHCNQFFVETTLCSALRNQDYKITLISSYKEGAVFGECTLPAFMLANHNENKKVLAMNQYIRGLEMKHQPDVIVIGIPGAAMPYDYRFSSDFGIVAYEISAAVKADFAILSHPCMPYDLQFFAGIEKALRGRLGVHIDIHSLSQHALDFFDDDKALSFLSVDDRYVDDMIAQIDYDNLTNLNSIEGVANAADRFINKLSDD